MSSLDALLGQVAADGVDQELMGGLDFRSPLTVTPNPTSKRLEIGLDEGAITVPGGATEEDVTDAANFPVMTISAASTDLTTAHVGMYLRCTHVTPTLNYDGGLPAGSLIVGVGTTGPITFTEDGTTINVEPDLTPVTRGAFAPFALKIVDTLEADLTGSLEPV